MNETITAPPQLRAEVRPPGDKSIAHRSLMLNAAAVGSARVENFPRGRDTLASLACVRALGVRVVEESRDGAHSTLRLTSQGVAGLREPEQVLDARNSGTSMRLLLGLLAGAPLTAVLTGDKSLRSRPMARVTDPLRQMGAQIWGRRGDSLAPLAVRGTKLHGMRYQLPVASAQVKSSLLLAGLSAEGPTVLREPSLSRDHTERMLQAMGISLKGEGGWLHLEPGVPRTIDVAVPADISGAAPWLVAGAIHPNARVKVLGVGVNPTRTGILDALRQMGARIRLEERGDQGGEPVADITVESSTLRGIEIGGEIIPRLIDELPVLALAATHAEGRTVIRDAQELRVKETDRIATTVQELTRLGARLEERPDGMVVYGGAVLRGQPVKSHGDHRLVMTLAVAGLVAQGETVIEGADAVEVSYPGFWDQLRDRLAR